MGENVRDVKKILTYYNENTVLSLLQKSGTIGNDFSGWSCDPYNPEFNKGFLMNQSEQRRFDEMFPEHPLSEARKLIEFIITNH